MTRWPAILCRCTRLSADHRGDGSDRGRAVRTDLSSAPARTESAAFDGKFFAPRTLGELLRLREAHPDAVLLAGGTDLGLLAGRSRTPPAELIHVAHVPEFSK